MSEVVFIGTSDAFGAGGRRQSALLLRGARGTVLVDCGLTTNTGLEALDLSREEIDTIVVSHFHGDHFGGIPSLLLAARYEDERTRPLRLAGPRNLEKRVRELAAALGHSLDDHEWTFDIEFCEVGVGRRIDVGPATLVPFATHHQLESDPHGYRIETGGETIVYSGDTGWFPELPGHAAGADLFVCECTFPDPRLDFHLSHEQLLENRAQFDVGRMVLTHLGREMSKNRERWEFEMADDGLVLKL